MNLRSTPSPDATSRDRIVAEFFAAVRAAARESQLAVAKAKPALNRIASAIVHRDNSQALHVRSILVSLYTGGSILADVSDLMALDWSLRKDLCAVLLAFGHGEFGYEYLKTAFETAGDRDAQWLLDAAPDAERLREALTFAKSGSLATTPRTLTERGIAEFVLSLFTGSPVRLQSALRSLDQSHAALVLGLVADFIAARFDDATADVVREFFGEDTHCDD